MRPAVGSQRHEQNALFTTPGDCTARGYAQGIRKKNNFQHYAGSQQGAPGLVVVEPGMKDRLIPSVIDKVAEGGFLNLFIEEDGNELSLAGRVCFVVGQGILSLRVDR